jgi:hypothetical protein
LDETAAPLGVSICHIWQVIPSLSISSRAYPVNVGSDFKTSRHYLAGVSQNTLPAQRSIPHEQKPDAKEAIRGKEWRLILEP